MGRIGKQLLSRNKITDRFRIGHQNLVPWLLSFDGRWGGFLGGRAYRRPILVGVSNQAVADYQIAVTFTVDTGKMNSDLSDLLFADPLGNILPHWVETISTTATVYVKIPTTSTTVKQLIYMYYGLASATNTSDIDAVMDVGLRAFIYDGTGFNTFLGTTIDTSVSHNWGSGVVSINGVGNQTDTTSIYWQGWVKPDGLGTTTFYCSSDDGQRLYVGGSLIVDNWVDQGTTERSANVNMNGIKSIQYNWYENGGGAVAMLGWDSVNSAKVYPIPSTFLRCKKYVALVPTVEVLSEEIESTIWNLMYKVIRGVFTMAAGSNSYRYVDLTNVSDYTIVSGDFVEFDLFWDNSGAEINLDLIASGWTLRDSGLTDQNGRSVHTSSVAHNADTLGKWHTRRIALTGAAIGKVISQYCIACEKDEAGTYTGYIANVKIWRGTSIVKNIYVGGSITESVVLNNGSNSHTLTANLDKLR